MTKNPAVKMSLLMGTTMSFVLSLIGNLSSGMFTVPGFLKSFCISFLISLIIGFIIPIKKISDALCEKAGARPGTLKARIIAAADRLYTVHDLLHGLSGPFVRDCAWGEDPVLADVIKIGMHLDRGKLRVKLSDHTGIQPAGLWRQKANQRRQIKYRKETVR